MNDVVLIAHVVAAILLLGPVTVAISMFPRLALAARGGGWPRDRAFHRRTAGQGGLTIGAPC